MAAREKFYPAQLSCDQQKRVAMMMFFIITSSLFLNQRKTYSKIYILYILYIGRFFSVLLFAYLREAPVNLHRKFTAKIGVIVKAN
jgi:hypothetical protein